MMDSMSTSREFFKELAILLDAQMKVTDIEDGILPGGVYEKEWPRYTRTFR